MGPSYSITSDSQLVRLLQIGVVLEEVIEAQATRHHETFDGGGLDEEVVELLDHATEESHEHRRRLEELLGELDADPVAYEEIERLVAAHYEAHSNLEDVLHDQRWGERTAYKYYDTLISAIEASDVEFDIDRDSLLATLCEIRADEREGVEEVTELIERRD